MYDAIENINRVRKGLVAVLQGRTIDFSTDHTPFIVVFDDPINKFSEGRVVLFQQFFIEQLGMILEIVKQVPACLKIFFKVDFEEPEERQRFAELIETPAFLRLCSELNISQIQFGSKMVVPARTNR